MTWYEPPRPQHRSVDAPCMDEIALALKMKRLARWIDSKCQPDGFAQRQFDTAPFGQCYVTTDRDRQGPTASFNRNRVYICGKEPGFEPDGLNRLIELFTAAGVDRFFVWLGPGPEIDVVRRWLGERGSPASAGPGIRPCAARATRRSGQDLPYGAAGRR